MAIESIGGVTATQTDSLKRAGLDQEDFLKILLTQLTFQDPLEPMDNQEFVAQMAQFTALEQSQQSNQKLESLLTIGSTSQALSLLNKTVDINTSTGTESGEITTIRFQEGVPLMTVLKSTGEFLTDITLSQISLVR